MLRSLVLMTIIMCLSACNILSATESSLSEVIVTATEAFAEATLLPATQTSTPMPTSTPLPEVAEAIQDSVVSECIPRTDWHHYTVLQGDTLTSIAQRTNSTATTLASANCLTNANLLQVGQQIRVPVIPTGIIPPLQSVLTSIGSPPTNLCVVYVSAGMTVNLFLTANFNEPMNQQLGNWGLWMSTVGEFHQIIIQPGTTQIVDAFVATQNVYLQGVGCPTTEQPSLPIFTGIGTPSSSACVADGRHSIPTIYRTTNINDPMGQLANWGLWISTVNDFYQITIQTSTTQIVNAFVRVSDIRLQGPSCPLDGNPPPQEPMAPVYFSVDPQPQGVCVAEAGRTGPTLYRTATFDDPMGSLGNWGLWISTVNGFYQITLQTETGQIINAFVLTSDINLHGNTCL